MLEFLSKLFGSANERAIKRLQPTVEKINGLETQISALSDEALRAKTDEFRSKIAHGMTLDSILPEAFAVVREASKRTVKMRHFDVQLMGGMVLHEGRIAEMATGEGKTLVATLPVYLNALSGKGVHVITVNDYLARRDRFWMGPIYEFLGLTVGVIQHDMTHVERQQAYASDITYGTNNEFGFDYLRDNMVADISQRVQRELNFGIVDEVDSILIDEARTPLIISGPAEESTDKYYTVNRVITRLKGRKVLEREQIAAKHRGEDLSQGYDFVVDEKDSRVYLTEDGESKLAELLHIDNLHDIETMEWKHFAIQALRAHNLFEKDVDYVVKDGQVIIVDEFTGRLMPGRRWSDGLHQAVEAKEGLKIERENQTLATITFQNYFRMYKKLAGMTGTALTEADEFSNIYKLDVINVPTNRPMSRVNYPDVVYRTEREKFNAVADEIVELHKIGRPVLVGTISIEKSERLSSILNARHLPHTVLNAKYHEKEAEIVAQAGQDSGVTIATNMAGRGTDIVLGEGVAQKGGLHVIGTERHEARRIDNQLRGRCARQGDPGSSRFYLSLEDDLMRLFGSDRLKNMMEKLGMEEGVDIQHPLISRSIENAQRRVETRNFEIRKDLLKFDDVMNRQREIVYSERDRVLKNSDLKEHMTEILTDVVDDLYEMYLKQAEAESEEEKENIFWQQVELTFGLSVNEIRKTCGKEDVLREDLVNWLLEILAQKEKDMGRDTFVFLEKSILLHVLDSKWKDHLYAMDHLRDDIHFRSMGQRDVLVEYRHEAFKLFDEMIRAVKNDVASFIFKAQIKAQEERKLTSVLSEGLQKEVHREFRPGAFSSLLTENQPARPAAPIETAPQKQSDEPITLRREAPKVGRNEPCPCGSGKKYKKCHGQEA
jgi:preprotein translocase subunit SecA